VSYEGLPGVVETREAFGETTLVVDPARLVDVCTLLRDGHGFNFLSDVVPTDYLGWGEEGVAGYIGTAGGRDLNRPGSQAYARLPEPKPKRFAVSYHLLRVSDDPGRLRVQVWIDDEQPVASVIRVWPAADWFEREAYDMMGIVFEGNRDLRRIYMSPDYRSFPQRKDFILPDDAADSPAAGVVPLERPETWELGRFRAQATSSAAPHPHNLAPAPAEKS
jgi:NADH-quinone oxidoreductase subunit C